MKQKVDKYNNWRVCIWKDGKEYTFLVARLVADAFCGEYRDTELTVNHIDGNRLNNNSDNLEWMTRADNIREGVKMGLYLVAKQDCTLVDEDENVHYFNTMADASRFMGRNSHYIRSTFKYGMILKGSDNKKYKLYMGDFRNERF